MVYIPYHVRDFFFCVCSEKKVNFTEDFQNIILPWRKTKFNQIFSQDSVILIENVTPTPPFSKTVHHVLTYCSMEASAYAQF
jgi:hypothetical protein